ncbi:UvsX-like recombinase [Brochothrix phage A9]|uniref:Gp150 n=1 Tax=Brochothrix phage A9 TaxID=857312 RepID=D9J0U7_9CAUD|nr:UvsX-like recombinase [Brochothrix phage A9]ADJ53184.1 gp150 [Brochothrix phage A9]
MARKKTVKGKDGAFDLRGLTEGLEGFSLLEDSTFATVEDVLPLLLPQIDSQLAGGFPFGRFSELSAKDGVGKSMTAIQATKIAVQMNAVVVWIDVEGTASKEQLSRMGIPVDRVIVRQPDPKSSEPLTVESVGESIADMLEMIAGQDIPLLIIWDSIGQTPGAKTMDKDFGNEQPGIHAKAVTNVVQKLAPFITTQNVLFMGINQVRDNMGATMFGPKTSTPGGRGLKHYASVRFELSAVGQLKRSIKGEQVYYAHKVRYKLAKSKVSIPNSQGEAVLFAGDGFNEIVNTYYTARNIGLLGTKTGGATYTTDAGEELSMAEQVFIEYLLDPENFEITKEIHQKLTMWYFPHWYPAFDNVHAKVDGIPLLEGLREKYEALGYTGAKNQKGEYM